MNQNIVIYMEPRFGMNIFRADHREWPMHRDASGEQPPALNLQDAVNERFYQPTNH